MAAAAPAAPASRAVAWVFSRAGEPLERVELSLGAPGEPLALEEGEALVALTAATVCGSDSHTIDGRRTDPAAPLILGHEGVGVVIALGAGGSGGAAAAADAADGSPLALGDRVTWSVAARGCSDSSGAAAAGCAACAE
jgi:threonine 3-dehydrogenase